MIKNEISKKIKSQPPARIITLGFAIAIIAGALLLCLPFNLKDGVSLSFIDALYTSTSAVCVTGLVTVDVADTFTLSGQIIVMLLIQIGGLGVMSISAGLILAMRKKINLRERNVLREALNMDSGKGVILLLKNIFLMTLIIEVAGALLSFIVFVQDFPPLKALWISIFHSVASFNNSGFDVLGNFQSLTAYSDNVLLNVTTALLIILGGLGFLVIREIATKKFKWKKFSMHTKVVLFMSALLIVLGGLLIKLSEMDNITWLGAFFQSVSARTAGFATFSLGDFKVPGLIVMIILMFIGASPGSTGGGIKTTTFFVIAQGIRTTATNKTCKAFHYSLPKNAFTKASVVFILGLSVVMGGSLLMSIFEPTLKFSDILFEVVSAYGTVGLSTGITQGIGVASKLLTIAIMFFGRLGPLTIVSILYFSPGDSVKYPEGNISIG